MKFRKADPSIDSSIPFFQNIAQKKSSDKKVYQEDEKEEDDDGGENHPQSKPASNVSSIIRQLRTSDMKVSSIIPKFRIRKFRNDIPSIDLSPFFFKSLHRKSRPRRKSTTRMRRRRRMMAPKIILSPNRLAR